MKQVNELFAIEDRMQKQIIKMDKTSKEYYEMANAMGHLRKAIQALIQSK